MLIYLTCVTDILIYLKTVSANSQYIVTTSRANTCFSIDTCSQVRNDMFVLYKVRHFVN